MRFNINYTKYVKQDYKIVYWTLIHSCFCYHIILTCIEVIDKIDLSIFIFLSILLIVTPSIGIISQY